MSISRNYYATNNGTVLRLAEGWDLLIGGMSAETEEKIFLNIISELADKPFEPNFHGDIIYAAPSADGYTIWITDNKSDDDKPTVIAFSFSLKNELKRLNVYHLQDYILQLVTSNNVSGYGDGLNLLDDSNFEIVNELREDQDFVSIQDDTAENIVSAVEQNFLDEPINSYSLANDRLNIIETIDSLNEMSINLNTALNNTFIDDFPEVNNQLKQLLGAQFILDDAIEQNHLAYLKETQSNKNLFDRINQDLNNILEIIMKENNVEWMRSYETAIEHGERRSMIASQLIAKEDVIAYLIEENESFETFKKNVLADTDLNKDTMNKLKPLFVKKEFYKDDLDKMLIIRNELESVDPEGVVLIDEFARRFNRVQQRLGDDIFELFNKPFYFGQSLVNALKQDFETQRKTNNTETAVSQYLFKNYLKKEEKTTVDQIVAKFNLLLADEKVSNKTKKLVVEMAKNYKDYIVFQNKKLVFLPEKYAEYLLHSSKTNVNAEKDRILKSAEKVLTDLQEIQQFIQIDQQQNELVGKLSKISQPKSGASMSAELMFHLEEKQEKIKELHLKATQLQIDYAEMIEDSNNKIEQFTIKIANDLALQSTEKNMFINNFKKRLEQRNTDRHSNALISKVYSIAADNLTFLEKNEAKLLQVNQDIPQAHKNIDILTDIQKLTFQIDSLTNDLSKKADIIQATEKITQQCISAQLEYNKYESMRKQQIKSHELLSSVREIFNTKLPQPISESEAELRNALEKYDKLYDLYHKIFSSLKSHLTAMNSIESSDRIIAHERKMFLDYALDFQHLEKELNNTVKEIIIKSDNSLLSRHADFLNIEDRFYNLYFPEPEIDAAKKLIEQFNLLLSDNTISDEIKNRVYNAIEPFNDLISVKDQKLGFSAKRYLTSLKDTHKDRILEGNYSIKPAINTLNKQLKQIQQTIEFEDERQKTILKLQQTPPTVEPGSSSRILVHYYQEQIKKLENILKTTMTLPLNTSEISSARYSLNLFIKRELDKISTENDENVVDKKTFSELIINNFEERLKNNGFSENGEDFEFDNAIAEISVAATNNMALLVQYQKDLTHATNSDSTQIREIDLIANIQALNEKMLALEDSINKRKHIIPNLEKATELSFTARLTLQMYEDYYIDQIDTLNSIEALEYSFDAEDLPESLNDLKMIMKITMYNFNEFLNSYQEKLKELKQQIKTIVSLDSSYEKIEIAQNKFSQIALELNNLKNNLTGNSKEVSDYQNDMRKFKVEQENLVLKLNEYNRKIQAILSDPSKLGLESYSKYTGMNKLIEHNKTLPLPENGFSSVKKHAKKNGTIAASRLGTIRFWKRTPQIDQFYRILASVNNNGLSSLNKIESAITGLDKLVIDFGKNKVIENNLQKNNKPS